MTNSPKLGSKVKILTFPAVANKKAVELPYKQYPAATISVPDLK